MLGFRAKLSDSALSDFTVDPKVDSIEVCLQNVRASNVVLVILNQRYGPSLGKFGYEDVSATHLEYREAKRHGIPIFMYVREALVGEHGRWNHNGQPNSVSEADYPFTKKNALGLFRFIEEHRALKSGGGSNWFWPFEHSVDLKQLISRDLRAQSNRAVLRRLIDEGKLPVLTFGVIYGGGWPAGEITLMVNIRNDQPMLDCEASTAPSELAADLEREFGQQQRFNDVLPDPERRPILKIRTQPRNLAEQTIVRIRYTTLSGHHIEDAIAVWVPREGKPAQYDHFLRALVERATYELG